ncbi:MAG: DegT/DnrJ/EryC1/StrS family aminotransferase, partial [Bacteroidales bacterium]|nr:DegT/DnrJ/EryC1/StrS family aminotransferase [Bacteroidales bacterium]
VDIGSSFLPSELISAFLYAQIEKSGQIQLKRLKLWNLYYKLLKPLEDKGYISLPHHSSESSGNGHIFYIVCKNTKQRKKIAEYLGEKQILAVTHYLGLHKSPYFKEHYTGAPLRNCDRYEDTLLRLPLYYEMRLEDVKYVCSTLGDILDYLNVK